MTGRQGDHALEIDSGPDNATLDAQPRSRPQLQSLTLLGGWQISRARDRLVRTFRNSKRSGACCSTFLNCYLSNIDF